MIIIVGKQTRSKPYCLVCSNFRGKQIQNLIVTLHRILKEKRVKRAWLKRLKLERKDFVRVSLHPTLKYMLGAFRQQEGDGLPSVFANKTLENTTVNNVQIYSKYFYISFLSKST